MQLCEVQFFPSEQGQIVSEYITESHQMWNKHPQVTAVLNSQLYTSANENGFAW